MSEKSKKTHTAAGAYRFGECDLYPSERQLHVRRKPVRLSPKTFDALLVFASNAERLVHRDELIRALWPDTFVTDANLTNIIVALRKILGRDAIQTVSKFGYRFCIPVVGEPGIDDATYAMFTRAKALVAMRSIDSISEARDHLTVCVAAEPNFAAAWAWLGRCARFLHKFRGAPANLGLAQAAFRRALAIDGDLACAHHFYTQLQVDLGDSRGAMVRLARRIVEKGDEPESYAGLVHACRYCGLLEESIAAHERATALDPSLVTSVENTRFLRGEYQATLETGVNRYYLDAAAWVALGDTARAAALLRSRLAAEPVSPLLGGLMRSLLAILEGRRADAADIMARIPVEYEPESTFYLARHYAMIDDATLTLGTLRKARSSGLASSYALEHDRAFQSVRRSRAFRAEMDASRGIERDARRALEGTGVQTRLTRRV